MILTRKLQLRLLDETHWSFFKKLESDVFRAYNDVVNTNYFAALFVDKICKTDEELKIRSDKLEKKIDTKKKKLKDNSLSSKEITKIKAELRSLYNSHNACTREAREKAKEFYGVSERNFGYDILKRNYSHIPGTIRTCINSDVFSNFKKDIQDIRSGKRSVRTYRKGVPIPFQLDKKKKIFTHENGNIIFHWINGIDFEIIFGKDKSSRRPEVEKIMAGELKMSDSKLQIKGKKIYLLLALNQSEEKIKLDKKISVGVDIGIVFPAYVCTNSGLEHKKIGSIDDLFKLRMQMQKRHKRLQKDLVSTMGGKGRKKKLKALERLKQSERNFVRTYNHFVSKEVVHFATQQKASTIFMEDLSGFGKNRNKGDIVLRNWSYFELQSMIEYKAKLKGIEVKKINPRNTSQMCALCGEKGNRPTQKQFFCLNKKCKNFNKEILADYNAAWNIAKGGIS